MYVVTYEFRTGKYCKHNFANGKRLAMQNETFCPSDRVSVEN